MDTHDEVDPNMIAKGEGAQYRFTDDPDFHRSSRLVEINTVCSIQNKRNLDFYGHFAV